MPMRRRSVGKLSQRWLSSHSSPARENLRQRADHPGEQR
jgi:hypothetical protein